MELKELIELIKGSKYLPKYLRDASGADLAFTFLKGEEIGLKPLQTLTALYEKEGMLCLNAAAMRALVLKAGHQIEIVEHTVEVCTIRGHRFFEHIKMYSETISFSLQDARMEGVLHRPFWVKHPKAMLLSRATGVLCRFFFADLIQGLYVDEELSDASQVMKEARIMDEAETVDKAKGIAKKLLLSLVEAPLPTALVGASYLIKSPKFTKAGKTQAIGEWPLGALRFCLGSPASRASLLPEDIREMEARVAELTNLENIKDIKLGE